MTRGALLSKFLIPSLAAVLLACLCLPALAGAAYREPALTVPAERLDAAFHCPFAPQGKRGKQPILLVTGTGVTGSEAFLIASGPFHVLGRPACYVDFPYRTTGDIQISVQYLVRAIQNLYKLAGQKIAMIGVSQGGLLPRWALTYWPSLRSKVTDVVAVAGTQHGSNIIGPCSALAPCVPAEWQQLAGSQLLGAINREPDESPGSTSWTTVRTLTDEVVQPQSGPKPTSSLIGATNISIQAVCPGRVVRHIPSALDSVTFAALIDAVTHAGPAKVSRLPKDVCSHPWAPGAPSIVNQLRISHAAAIEPDPQTRAPLVAAEPAVQPYALKTVPR